MCKCRRLISRQVKKSRGIALPVAIAIILVLITLVLALILQSRTTGGMHRRSEKKMKQADTAEVVGGKMQDIFASGTSPDPAKLKEIGMSSAPPAPGKGKAEFSGKIGDIEFSGSFNEGDGPWSTYVPVPDEIDPKNFSYDGPQSASFDPEKLPVPPNHSLIFVKVKAPDQEQKIYYYMFSNNSPYGLIAPNGSVKIKNGSATSTSKPSPEAGDDSATSHNFYVYAADKINIDGKLTGTARTQKPESEAAVKLGTSETGKIENQFPPIPPEELQKIIEQVQTLMSKLENNAEDPGFAEMAAALMGAAALFQGTNALVDRNGFSFDGEKMIWNNSLIVPEGMAIMIPFPLKINGDLLIMDKAVVVVGGKLDVERRLFLGEESGLMCQGDIEIMDRVNVTYSPKDIAGISASIMSEDDITLHRGVRHLKFKPGHGETEFGFDLLPCPFPEYIKVGGEKIPNPVAIAFKKMQKKVFEPLKAAMGPLSMFLTGKISVPVGSEDRDIPGLLIISEKGKVKIEDHDKDAGLAGLIICKKGVVIEFPPDGSGIFTGILLTLEGNIELFNVKYRYYPYYTSAAVPINGGGDTETLQVMPQPHLISSGEYKQ